MTHALLLGMGGSSLAPEVLKMTFGDRDGFPQLHVLDSTDPSQVQAFAGRVDLAKTLVIVASKSGSTLEPNILKQYFFEQVRAAVGAEQVGSRFIAITDPGSQLDRLAQQEQFRHVFYGVPSIGGRYSALSNFGMAPAAVMGLDAVRFLQRAQTMARACSAEAADNPGVRLGVVLGELAKSGRDKITLITSPPLWDLGAWLEQLLAESTGKVGKGLIPVDRETLGAPDVYGDDRAFVYVRLSAAPDAAQDAAVEALERAGQAVIRIPVSEVEALGQEFYRWEMATAVAGAVLGINPFDQPDVEASKVVTRELTDAYEATGALPRRRRFSRPTAWRSTPTPTTPPHSVKPLAQMPRSPPISACTCSGRCRAITSPSWPIYTCVPSTKRACKASAIWRAAPGAWRPAWVLARAFCIPPGKLIKAAPIRASFSRLPVTKPTTWPCPDSNTPLALSKRPRRAAIFRCWRSGAAALYARISAQMYRRAWRR